MVRNSTLKKIIAVAMTANLSLALSSCGSSNDYSNGFPDLVINETSGDDTVTASDINVDFYIDNIENVKAIDLKNSEDNLSFFNSVFYVNRTSFYTTDYCMSLEPQSGVYSLNKSSDAIEKLCFNDSFYITSSTENTRKNPGILNLLYNTESTPLRPDAVTAVFTDLSEQRVHETAEIMRKKYADKEGADYNFCLISSNMLIDDNMGTFYIAGVNDKVIKVDEKTIPNLSRRNYYLLIAGPTSKLSSYVYHLKTAFETNGLKEGKHYNISEYNFSDHEFVQSTDLNENYIYENSGEEEDIKTIYDSNTIRLDSKEKSDLPLPYRGSMSELSYNKKAPGINSGYELSYSKDYSYHASLDIKIDGQKVGYSTYTTDMDDSNEKINPNVLNYAFGKDVNVFYQKKGEWIEMDAERKERYFNHISTDNGVISIVSDHTDEENLGDIYMTVPVLQKISIKNCPPEWVEDMAYDGSQSYDAKTAPYAKTYDLRQFYGKLFDVSIENNNDNMYKDKVKIMYGQVGTVRILVDNN